MMNLPPTPTPASDTPQSLPGCTRIQKAMAYLPVNHFLFFLSLRKGVREWPSSMFTTHFLCARILSFTESLPHAKYQNNIFLIPHFNILENFNHRHVKVPYLTLININTYSQFNPLSIFFTRTPKDCLYFLHLCPAALFHPFHNLCGHSVPFHPPTITGNILSFCLILPYNNLNNCLNSLRQ